MLNIGINIRNFALKFSLMDYVDLYCMIRDCLRKKMRISEVEFQMR
jgi:hypothetical protein